MLNFLGKLLGLKPVKHLKVYEGSDYWDDEDDWESEDDREFRLSSERREEEEYWEEYYTYHHVDNADGKTHINDSEQQSASSKAFEYYNGKSNSEDDYLHF